jgi:hypothetical protein
VLRRALIVLAVVAAFGGCGDDKPAARAAGPSPPQSKGCASPAGNVAASVIDPQAIWPPVPRCTSDPAVIARSFATEYIGIQGEPAIGEYRDEERNPPAVKIDIFRRGEDGRPLDGILTTLTLRVLDDAHHWYVTSAESPSVKLTTPAAGATVGSPVTVEGRGRGFEGNVVIEVRAAYAATALSLKPVTAGAFEALEPFRASLKFVPPTGVKTGAIVAKSASGIEEPGGFAAVLVRF